MPMSTIEQGKVGSGSCLNSATLSHITDPTWTGRFDSEKNNLVPPRLGSRVLPVGGTIRSRIRIDTRQALLVLYVSEFATQKHRQVKTKAIASRVVIKHREWSHCNWSCRGEERDVYLHLTDTCVPYTCPRRTGLSVSFGRVSLPDVSGSRLHSVMTAAGSKKSQPRPCNRASTTVRESIFAASTFACHLPGE